MALLNPYTLRKYSALLLNGGITVILFYVGIVYYGLWWGVGFFFGGLILGMIIANMLLKNPFSMMLEGKGIITFNMDSTGILQPFIIRVAPPYIKGKLFKKEINDIFNRNTVFNLAEPVEAETKAVNKIDKDGKKILEFRLDEKEYNKARFSFIHYPLLIYNEQVGSLITKDFLSNTEKTMFIEHSIMYLNRKLEGLTDSIRDFGRYIVELQKPKSSFFQNKWVWIIIGVGLLALAAMFVPKIMEIATEAGGGVIQSVMETKQTITPITP